jgi:hypothetical protein
MEILKDEADLICIKSVSTICNCAYRGLCSCSYGREKGGLRLLAAKPPHKHDCMQCVATQWERRGWLRP